MTPPSASVQKERWQSCAAPVSFQRPAVRPAAIGLIAAATVRPTQRSTVWSSCECAATSRPSTTSAGARPRGRASPRSSDASSGSSHAKSSATFAARPTQHPRRKWPLDLYRSINALPETINGSLKAEVIHRRGPWRTLEAVEFTTL